MKNDDLDDIKRQLDLYLNGRLSGSGKEHVEKMVSGIKQPGDEIYAFNEEQQSDLFNRIKSDTYEQQPLQQSNTWLRIAAIFALVSVASLLTLYLNWGLPQQSGKVILPDGTLVWLTEGSKLEHPDFFVGDVREVRLNGEALFEVAKDQAHPFIIYCGRYVARVVGTSFNLKTTDDHVELTVLTGRVKLTSSETDSSVVVGSHEHVIFSQTTGIVSKRNSDNEDVKELSANLEYNMSFEDTRMREIIQRVEGKFNVAILLENDDILNCMISADFTDQSLPVTLSMISEALGVEYEIAGDHVVIRGEGCKE